MHSPLLTDIARLVDKAIADANAPLLRQIHQLQSENHALLAELRLREDSLAEKTRELHHLTLVLAKKSAEWRQIKHKLAQYRSLRQVLEPEPEPESEPDAPLPPPEVDPSTGTTAGTLTATGTDNDTDTGSHDSLATQMPMGEASTLAHGSQLLDCLIDICDNAPIPPPPNPSVPSTSKRKRHRLGCPCCANWYQATRTTTTTTDDTLEHAKTPPGFWDTAFTPHP